MNLFFLEDIAGFSIHMVNELKCEEGWCDASPAFCTKTVYTESKMKANYFGFSCLWIPLKVTREEEGGNCIRRLVERRDERQSFEAKGINVYYIQFLDSPKKNFDKLE